MLKFNISILIFYTTMLLIEFRRCCFYFKPITTLLLSFFVPFPLIGVRVYMVFNTTINNISVISWQSVLLVVFYPHLSLKEPLQPVYKTLVTCLNIFLASSFCIDIKKLTPNLFFNSTSLGNLSDRNLHVLEALLFQPAKAKK